MIRGTRRNTSNRSVRNQNKLQKLRDKVRQSTQAFMERHQTLMASRLAWWRKAFRVPNIANWWVFSKARTLWAAFLALLGLKPASAGSTIHTIRRDSQRRRSYKRATFYEPLESRQLLAYDIEITSTPGTLDSDFATKGGVVLFADGSGSASISTSALQSAASAGKSIRIEANSITFNHTAALSLTGATKVTLDTRDGTTNYGAINTGTFPILTNGTQVVIDAGSTATIPALTAGANITVTSQSDVTVGNLSGVVVSLTSANGDVESSTGTLITATNQINTTAKTGINVLTDTPAITANNSTSGDLKITQPNTTAQNLSVTSLINSGSGAVTVANDGPGNMQLTFSGTVTNTNNKFTASATGDVRINTSISSLGETIVKADSDGLAGGSFEVISGNSFASNNQTISITAADLTMGSGASINSGSARTTIVPSTNSRPIKLGTGAASDLTINDTELDNISAGVLEIGSASSADISITAAMSKAGSSPLVLVTSTTITDSASLTVANLRVAAGGNVTLDNSGFDIDTLAGSAASLVIKDIDDLIIGSVDTVNGVSTTANGNITLQQDDLNIAQAVNAGTGEVTIFPTTSSRGISVGSFEVSDELHVTEGEEDKITASILRFGKLASSDDAENSGTIFVTGGVSRAGTISLVTDGTVQGNGITATNLAIRAGNGVGLSGDDLQLVATNLAIANTLNTPTSGSVVNIRNTSGTVTIAGDLAKIDGLSGVVNEASGSSGVRLSTDGSIVVDGDVNSVQHVIIDATGAGNITINDSVNSTNTYVQIKTNGGAVSFSAAGDVTANTTLEVMDNSSSRPASVSMADGTVFTAGEKVTVLASGNIGIGRIVSTSSDSDAIKIDTTGGSILDNGDTGGADIVATSGGVVLNAEKGIGDNGTTENALETDAAILSFVNAGASVANDVLIIEANSASVSGSNSASGGFIKVELTTGTLTVPDGAGTDLSTNNGAISLTADDMTITGTVASGTGDVTLAPKTAARVIDIGDDHAGTELDLSATELNKITTTGTLIIGSNDAGIINSAAVVLTGTSKLQLDTKLAVTNDTGTIAVDNLTINAASVGVSGNALSIDVENLTSTTSADVYFSETDGVNLVDVDAGSGTIELTASNGVVVGDVKTTNATTNAVKITSTAGSITQGAGDGIEANTAVARATLSAKAGIGESGTPVKTNVAQLDLTNSSTGGIFVAEADSVQINKIAQAASGDVSIATTAGTIEVLSKGSGIVVATGAVSLDANGSSADVVVNEEISSSGGDITIKADRDVSFSSDGDVFTNGGNISITADDLAGAHGGKISSVAGTAIGSLNGQITLVADGNITLGSSGLSTNNSSASAITITSANGQIVAAATDSGVEVSANAGTVTLNAATGISIDTSAETLVFNNTSGNVSINETDVVLVSGENTGGNVAIEVVTTGVSLTVNPGGIIADHKSVTLVADNMNINNQIKGADVVLTTTTTTTPIAIGLTLGSHLHLSDAMLNRVVASNSLTIGDSSHNAPIKLTGPVDLVTTSEDVTTLNLITKGAVTDEDGAADPVLLTVKNLSITAASIGTSTEDVDIKVETLVTDTTGDQFIEEADGLTDVSLDAGAADIVLTIGGDLNDADGSVDVIANDLKISGTVANVTLDTKVDTLDISTTTGNVDIDEDGSLELKAAGATTGDISVSATDVISISDTTILTNGGDLSFEATNGLELLSDVTIDTDNDFTGTAGSVSFSGKIDGAKTLTIYANSATGGAVALNDDVGSSTPLNELVILGGQVDVANLSTVNNVALVGSKINLNGTSISSADGNIDLNGDVTLKNGPILIDSDSNDDGTDGSISVGGTINGPHALSLDASTGDITLNGDVGNTTPVSSLNLIGNTLEVFNAKALGAISITGTKIDLNGTSVSSEDGNITLTGNVNLNDDLTIDSDSDNDGTDGSISVTGTINGARALTVDADTGAVSLGGDVGNTAALTSLSVTGGQLDIDDVKTVG
ncbi:MAG: hypothetical protein J0M26_25920, partial [Planctomycetes bacterium]|nr:hypothetical protein [Planctomycetota bacterium]